MENTEYPDFFVECSLFGFYIVDDSDQPKEGVDFEKTDSTSYKE